MPRLKMMFKILIIPAIIALIYLGYLLIRNHYYRLELQEIYDRQNPHGNHAFCISAADLNKNDYPYTTFFYGTEYQPEGEFKDHTNGKAALNGRYNQVLYVLARYGLFTEVPKGEDKGYPIYQYALTDKGEENVYWALGSTNFCFGRMVVDWVKGVSYSRGSLNSEIKTIFFSYHIENIPDWIQDPNIYRRYQFSEAHIKGKRIGGGWHQFAGNRTLTSIPGGIRP